MNLVINEKAIRHLNTLSPKEKERFLEFAQELKEKYDLRNEVKRSILESDNYILWLIKFTEDHPIFSSDDWIYTPNLISKEDNDNVFDLELLFEIIENFAKRNFISLYSTEWGGYYLIEYNGIGFKIEVAVGQGTVFACERLNEVTPDFIDFKLIQKNEELENTKEIRSKFDTLNKYIKELSQTIPVTVIRDELSNTLNEIMELQKNSDDE